MKTKTKHRILFWVPVLLALFSANASAQKLTPPVQKGPRKAAIYTQLPSGYQQVGNTKLYNIFTYRGVAGAANAGSIDIIGKYDNRYYSSTYNDGGYRCAIKVGNNSAAYVNCVTGSTINGISVTTSVEPQGDLARIVYTVKNNNSTSQVISMGVHADVMIGDNDGAPIIRRVDTEGKTYGLSMLNGNGAQMCALFGDGLTGVTAVDDFWFGFYSYNLEPTEMVGNYVRSLNWMVENGSYDSGMGWCWKNRTIPAGETMRFSYIIGVGEVNLVPETKFRVECTNLEVWNDLDKPHQFCVYGFFESPFGQNGYIEYRLENSEQWVRINSTPIQSGTNFTERFTVNFDPERTTHTLHFRTRDYVGNLSELPTSEWPDISFYSVTGLRDYVYTGSPITQSTSDLVYNLGDLQWSSRYANNINVGTAHYIVEGVYSKTIGRIDCPFEITPQPLAGGLNVRSPYYYTGDAIIPEWSFTEQRYNSLVEGRDYTVEYTDNTAPGTGKVTVTGMGNYTGVLTGTFEIKRLTIPEGMYTVELPPRMIPYDGLTHGASVTTNGDIGTATISYTTAGGGDFTTERPSAVGSYDIYLEISGSDSYEGFDKVLIYTFTIYEENDDEGVVIDTKQDNSDVLDDNDGEETNVTIDNLTMRAYTWNTLCVPFDATMEQVYDALGEDADVEELVRSTYNTETMLLTLYFTPRTEIIAGKPYVVKVATDIVKPVFHDVTIKNVEPETIHTEFTDMTGSYNPYVMTAGDRGTLFISNNKFYYPTSSGPLPGTKCWFSLLGEAWQGAYEATMNMVNMISFDFENTSTTSIISIANNETSGDNAWYTLQGQKVSVPSKGIYIHNGKKVVVK